MSKFTVIFSSVLVILAVFSVYLNISLRRERNELKLALEASISRIEELRHDIEKQAEVLNERDNRISALARDKYVLNKKIKEAAEHEQEVKLWIDTTVPDSVSQLLREGKSDVDNPSTTAQTVQ